MTRGYNRAHTTELLESYLSHAQNDCIFISHKYEDLDAAQKVADYIMDYGIDVYLDDCDHNLQKAVAANNSEGIVACIENGLNWSTHILVLITENTRMSWWVPYETGYAKKGGKGIASLLLKEADEFPDYLKIETALNGFTDLTNFLDTLSMPVTMMEAASLDFERDCVERRHRDSLLEYIRR